MGATITRTVEKLDEIEKAMAAKELGDEIERLRAREGWSQEELGKRIGLSQSRVSRIISGEHNFPLETVYRLGVAFGVNPFELAAIYWGIEVEQLPDRDREFLNNLFKLFDAYRQDIPFMLPTTTTTTTPTTGTTPHPANEQTYTGLKEASNINKAKNPTKKTTPRKQKNDGNQK